jgi:dTDP-4-dehydrorhamnose reductase
MIVITGAGGQVGREFPAVNRSSRFLLTLCDRSKLDIRDRPSVESVIGSLRPDAVVNAAAYTAVDRAESDVEACVAVNRDGARNLAIACERLDIPLIHISTDYVFDGRKASPYVESDPTAPLNVYGLSKAEGEVAVRAVPRHVILRTSWVYGIHGSNFVKTMLRLGTEREELRIVDDQRACPTAAADLAAAVLRVCEKLLIEGADTYGPFHCAGRGTATWFGFATAVFDAALAHSRRKPILTPIPTQAYPLPAARPENSVLDCGACRRLFQFDLPHWRESVASVVRMLASADTGASRCKVPALATEAAARKPT